MKKEILFSFNVPNNKRKREFLFEYQNYSILNEYAFLYQRDGVSLNIEYLKDLVTLSKKAPRSSLLFQFFVSHRERFEIKDNTIKLKLRKPFRFFPKNNFKKVIQRRGFRILPFPVRGDIVFDKNLKRNFNKYLFLRIRNNITNEIENFNLYAHENVANNIENINLHSLYDKEAYYSKNNFYHIYNTSNSFEIINLYNLNYPRITNDFEQSFLNKRTFSNSFKQYFLEQNSKIGSSYQNDNLSQNNKVLNNFNIYMFNIYTKYINAKYSDLYLNKHDNNINNVENYYSLKSSLLIANIFNQFSLKNNDNKNMAYLYVGEIVYSSDNVYVNVFKTIQAKAFEKILNAFNYYLGKEYNKIANSFEYNSGKQEYIHLNYFNNIENHAIPSKLNAFNSTFFDFMSYDYNKLYYVSNNIIMTKNYNYLNDIINIYLSKTINSNKLSYSDIDLIRKYYNELFIKDNIDFAKEYNILLNSFVVAEFVSKYNLNLERYNKFDSISKSYSYLNIDKTYTYIDRSKYKLYFDTNYLVESNNRNFSIYDRILKLNKEKHLSKIMNNMIPVNIENNKLFFFKKYDLVTSNIRDLSFIDNIYELYKDNYALDKNNIIYSLTKEKSSIRILLNHYFLNKNNHIISEFNNLYGVYKEDIDIDVQEYLYEITKTIIPITYTNQQYSILSINKINKHAFVDDIYRFAIKRWVDLYINNDITMTKIIGNIFFDNDLVCDKLAQNANFIYVLNMSIVKNKIHTWFFNNDIFITKKYINIFEDTENEFVQKYISITTHSFVTVIKNIRDVFIKDNEHIFKLAKDSRIDNLQDSYYKKYKLVDSFSQEWLGIYKLAFLNQDETIFKMLKDTYVDDNVFNSSVKQKDLYRQDNNEFLNTLNILNLYEIDKLVKHFDLDIYENFLVSKDIFLDILPEFNDVIKIVKEANITTDPITDWAWIYQDEEPFDDPFKIDELLLPENDTRYEDLENIIFNRDTLKPRAPIKIIDDYTFIAKYPNHYPIKDKNNENAYKDVALKYLEVRTSIMRQVFLGYYQLWQNHIFEFSRMTIPQSAKKILDYLYVWILMNFAEEDIPEALRTFRLVRWYIERGIIECSEYYIQYNPDDLTSGKMNTTNLEIPNDIGKNINGKINDTMYIDTNIHVIRNNKMKLHSEAYVTFFIDNKRDTTISFDLHTFTPVYIILNEGTDYEQILDTITLPTTSKMVYNIPYTGNINEFKIKKLGVDNNDNYFFVGNIVIKGMGSHGELEIEFNPKIQGNKLLSHVSNKVIQYMNLYEDNETLIQNISKGNVHLNEVYDRLLEYWNIHWQDKDKGKRWTIKRT